MTNKFSVERLADDIQYKRKNTITAAFFKSILLKKLKGIERLMHFKYEYNIEGQLVSKNLFGNNNDSLRWREFYKYLSNGKLWKIIRFDPSKVHPDNKINGLDPDDPENMPWGETYSYNDSGEIK